MVLVVRWHWLLQMLFLDAVAFWSDQRMSAVSAFRRVRRRWIIDVLVINKVDIITEQEKKLLSAKNEVVFQ